MSWSPCPRRASIFRSGWTGPLKGLAVQPEDRFQSAEEFLDAIEGQRVVEVPGQSPAASQTGLKGLLETARRKPRQAAAIAAAALALIIGVGVLGGGGSGDEEGGGGGIAEALAPKVTIAGQEVSAADKSLDLIEGTLTNADIETMKQMSNLKRIYLEGVSIETVGLDWVAQFPQLEEFSCQGYYADELDLTPFTGLTDLTRLSFYQNNNGVPASDLTPLVGLAKLKRLDLCVDFDVTDLAPLAGLTQMENLRIYGNSNSSRSGLTDISGLAGMTKLTSLQLDLGNVKDFSSLAGLTGLKEIYIYGDYVMEDLSFLRGLTEPRTLNMGGSGSEGAPVLANLRDLSGLTHLTNLLLYVPVASLDGLETLTGLRELRMYGTGSTYTDVDALAGLTELTTLYLPYRDYNSENPLPPINLDGLKNLTKLQSLNISGEPESLEPLRDLTELRSLTIQGNDSRARELDLSHLSGLTKLTDLYINGDIAGGDLSALSSLTQLRSLRIYHNDRNYDRYENRVVIRDLSPLAGMTKLNSLQVNGTMEGIDTTPVAHISDLNIS